MDTCQIKHTPFLRRDQVRGVHLGKHRELLHRIRARKRLRALAGGFQTLYDGHLLVVFSHERHGFKNLSYHVDHIK